MAAKIRCDDEVIILTGKDKGKHGKVKSILSKKAIVTGLNLVKKNQKPIPSINQPGGIIEKEAAIDLSNIALFNRSANKRERIGFKFNNKKKVRILKSDGKVIK